MGEREVHPGVHRGLYRWGGKVVHPVETEALNTQACINICQTKTLKEKKWTHCLGIQAEGDPFRGAVGMGVHLGDPLHLVEVVEGYQHQEGEGKVDAL